MAIGFKVGTSLPAIPAKRYFTIGEVAELCGVKPHVLRYWEQEFAQLRPMKRRGNRRYYQHHEVLMIRRIRDLLYEQGFTISGARNQLEDPGHLVNNLESPTRKASSITGEMRSISTPPLPDSVAPFDWSQLRHELKDIQKILSE